MMDTSTWTLQQKLAYLTGKLSMADKMIAELRKYHAGVMNRKLADLETARAEVVKEIEALAGVHQS